MKKLICVLLCFALGTGLLAGCSGEKTPEPTGELVVCVEELYADVVRGFFTEFESRYPDVELTVLRLPSVTVSGFSIDADTSERDNFIAQLRTEIMAGQGPDMFIMCDANQIYGGMRSDGVMGYNSRVLTGDLLFPDAEKTMQGGVFCDLVPLMQLAGIEQDDFIQPILEAGRVEGRQVVLPLGYTLQGVSMAGSIYHGSPFEDGSAQQDTVAFLDTLTAYLEAGAGVEAILTNPYFYMQEPAPNYAEGSVAIDAEYFDALAKACLRNSLAYTASRPADETIWFPEYDNTSLIMTHGSIGYGPGTSTNLNNNDFRRLINNFERYEEELAFVPVPNQQGGVTAAITTWAGVRANSENKYNAAQLLALLASPGAQMYPEPAKEIGELYSGHGTLNYLPTRLGCLEAACDKLEYPELLTGTLLDAESRITTARFISAPVMDLWRNGMYEYNDGVVSPGDALQELQRTLRFYMEE